jgi:hypothetical protein
MACQDGSTPQGGDALSPEVEALGVSTDASAQLFAALDLNGTLLRGNRVTGAIKLGTGQYEVTFNRDVSGCAYVATTSNAYSQALQAFTAGGHLSANGVFVETKNQGGGLTDGPFQLVVSCGGTGIQYAVVGYSSNLVRATAGTTLSFLGTGRYQVTFPAAVGSCAYLASVGDPASGLVFSPSAVYTASGPNTRTIYLETKNPGGGLQDNVPFHLLAICPSTSTRIAVVRPAGPIQRASAGTTASLTSLGNYNVKTNLTLSSCAVIATRGSVGPGVPFAPATVEIIPGLGATSFGAQVRTLLFFGGALQNQAIHTAAVC